VCSCPLQVLFSWGKLGKPKMKQDGANEEAWVQGLATLVGCGKSGTVCTALSCMYCLY
jgi:hypothetical protein